MLFGYVCTLQYHVLILTIVFTYCTHIRISFKIFSQPATSTNLFLICLDWICFFIAKSENVIPLLQFNFWKKYICFDLPKMAPRRLEQGKCHIYEKLNWRREMTFSDFVIKKQIQSRQLRKRLVEVAGCEKIFKLILVHRFIVE